MVSKPTFHDYFNSNVDSLSDSSFPSSLFHCPIYNEQLQARFVISFFNRKEVPSFTEFDYELMTIISPFLLSILENLWQLKKLHHKNSLVSERAFKIAQLNFDLTSASSLCEKLYLIDYFRKEFFTNSNEIISFFVDFAGSIVLQSQNQVFLDGFFFIPIFSLENKIIAIAQQKEDTPFQLLINKFIEGVIENEEKLSFQKKVSLLEKFLLSFDIDSPIWHEISNLLYSRLDLDDSSVKIESQPLGTKIFGFDSSLLEISKNFLEQFKKDIEADYSPHSFFYNFSGKFEKISGNLDEVFENLKWNRISFFNTMRGIHPFRLFRNWDLALDHYYFAIELFQNTFFKKLLSGLEVVSALFFLLSLYADPFKKLQNDRESNGKISTVSTFLIASIWSGVSQIPLEIFHILLDLEEILSPEISFPVSPLKRLF